MQTLIRSFKSANGQDTIACHIWPCGGEPKGIIHIVHGMCEYGLRYEPVAEYFNGRGFIVCAHDHIGHGESVASDGMLGWLGEKNGAETLVADTQAAIRMVKEAYPGVKLIVFGHSMGSFVARLWAAKYGDEADALLLSGTAGGNPLYSVLKGIAAMQRAVLGDKKPGKLIALMLATTYLKRIPSPRYPCDWISTDERVAAAYMKDKYCRFIFTHSGYRELMRLLIGCNRADCFAQTPEKLPILLIAGGEDPVGNYGKGVTGVYEKYKQAGVQSVEIRLFDGMRHEPHNEIRRRDALNFEAEWIEKRIE